MIRCLAKFQFVAVLCSSLFAACSQPILEPADCLSSRPVLRSLYSMHMDSGPNPKGRDLEKMKGLVSKELYARLTAAKQDEADILTQSADFPKAFRAGECRLKDGKPEFDVLLFWRTEELNTEKKISVSAVNENGWVVAGAKTAE